MPMRLIDDSYLNNIHLDYHEESITWVEYFGTKLEQYDKKAVEIMGRIINAICDKHHIIFLKCLRNRM